MLRGLPHQANFHVLGGVDFFTVQKHASVSDPHNQARTDRAADVDLVAHQLLFRRDLTREIALSDAKGAAFAGGFDHIIYGWLFFAVVIALVLLQMRLLARLRRVGRVGSAGKNHGPRLRLRTRPADLDERDAKT